MSRIHRHNITSKLDNYASIEKKEQTNSYKPPNKGTNMPKKKRSPARPARSAAQLAADKARSEAMKAAASQATTRMQTEPVETKSNLEVEDLRKQIEELKNLITNSPKDPTPPVLQNQQVTSRGIVGVTEKYVMDPDYYPNPVERLEKEPRLQPFAFSENFEIAYECAPIRPYETKDGRLVTEPQFTLRLIRKVRDDDTNELTNERYVLRKGVFFEDPQTAIVIAKDHGVDFNTIPEREFLDEMRYIRFRDWLYDGFFPPKSDQQHTNKHEVVIDNRLVEVYETSSSEAKNIKNLI